MPFYDLNVSWTQNDSGLQQTLNFLDELGYNVFALNHTLAGKLPGDLTCPIPAELPFQLPKDAHVLRRCTLIFSDPSQNYRLSNLNSCYDIVALRPCNEKSFQLACSKLECDIISLDLTTRFEFFFGMNMLSLAVERGIKLEICYSPGIFTTDTIARRNFISNATQLIRASRGRGIIISSEASRASACRAPADVINLAALWGLSQEKGKEALGRLSRSVIVSAQLRRTSFKGVVDVVYGGQKPPEKKEDANSKKRKADPNGSVVSGELIPTKPMSKREQKRQRKEALKTQNSQVSTT